MNNKLFAFGLVVLSVGAGAAQNTQLDSGTSLSIAARHAKVINALVGAICTRESNLAACRQGVDSMYHHIIDVNVEALVLPHESAPSIAADPQSAREAHSQRISEVLLDSCGSFLPDQSAVSTCNKSAVMTYMGLNDIDKAPLALPLNLAH